MHSTSPPGKNTTLAPYISATLADQSKASSFLLLFIPSVASLVSSVTYVFQFSYPDVNTIPGPEFWLLKFSDLFGFLDDVAPLVGNLRLNEGFAVFAAFSLALNIVAG